MYRVNVGEPAQADQKLRADLKLMVRFDQVAVHAGCEPLLDFLDLLAEAAHQHVNVRHGVMLADPAHKVEAVELAAEPQVRDDESGGACLKKLPEFAGGGKGGNVCSIQHQLVFEVGAILRLTDSDIDTSVGQACHVRSFADGPRPLKKKLRAGELRVRLDCRLLQSRLCNTMEQESATERIMETNFENLEKAQSLIARERVLRDLRTLARDAEGLMKATAGDLSDKAREARAHLAGALENAKATCTKLQEQTFASARAAARQADSVIRANPYESVGIAFGVGLLIGVLVARR
jgi:ElaB/YqjD/DUF883 family membrane-anchored ribosome-binding protein